MCGGRKLTPSKVAPRGSTAICCHASVRGCAACASLSSPTLRMLVVPAPAVLATCMVACLLFRPTVSFCAYGLAIQRSPRLGKVLEKRHREEEPDRQVPSNAFFQ